MCVIIIRHCTYIQLYMTIININNTEWLYMNEKVLQKKEWKQANLTWICKIWKTFIRRNASFDKKKTLYQSLFPLILYLEEPTRGFYYALSCWIYIQSNPCFYNKDSKVHRIILFPTYEVLNFITILSYLALSSWILGRRY